MAKKEVLIAITKNGIATDFSGFIKDLCFDEAEKIRAKLGKLGVKIEVKTAEKKPEITEDERQQYANKNKIGE
ncbi:MAG: hypothetical protein HY226_05610 [Candidatus Vogelbacteria bacterium]|nr:hypothetical protein [Candidatus Vogelbacteria bacterium]